MGQVQGKEDIREDSQHVPWRLSDIFEPVHYCLSRVDGGLWLPEPGNVPGSWEEEMSFSSFDSELWSYLPLILRFLFIKKGTAILDEETSISAAQYPNTLFPSSSTSQSCSHLTSAAIGYPDASSFQE